MCVRVCFFSLNASFEEQPDRPHRLTKPGVGTLWNREPGWNVKTEIDVKLPQIFCSVLFHIYLFIFFGAVKSHSDFTWQKIRQVKTATETEEPV